MKKRLMCLCLCLVTLLSLTLTACSEKTDEEMVREMILAQSKEAYTLTMWVVSENKVEKDVAAEISKAVNDLTQTKHSTNLVLKFFTPDEYYEALSKTLAAYSVTATGKVPEIGDFEIPDNGLYEAIYREEQPNQVDIIYVGNLVDEDGTLLMSGEEMYKDLRANGHLAAVGKYMQSAAVKKIHEFLSPTLLGAVKEGDETYAIPNNNVIGSYTYMLLNKDLMDRYSMQGKLLDGKMSSFYSESVYSYLNMVLADASNAGKVLPVDASYEECLSMLAYYWNVDPDDFSLNSDDFSIFGSLYGDAADVTLGKTVLGTSSLFENPAFVSAYLQLNKFRLDNAGFFRGEDNANASYDDVALKFYEGDLDDVTIQDGVAYYYEGNECYYAIPVQYPTVTAEDLYDSMFAVCAYAPQEQIERSMKILAYLNTDREIRNILQYGVEGEHYNVVDGKAVRTEKGEDYRVDLFTTGNAFLAYPEAWISDTAWENGKAQNRDALTSPVLGFDLLEYALSKTSSVSAFKDPVTHKHSLSYKTGLNKEILLNNLVLKDWIERCDKKAGGVYVYKNVERIGKEYKTTLYVYNTLSESDMVLESTSIFDKAKKEIGLDLLLSYESISTTDTSVLGYELSVISYNYPTDYKGSLLCEVDGKRTAIALETRNRALNVDLFNTDTYSVNAVTDLTIAHFYGNDAIYDQLVEWKNEVGNMPTNYVLTWTESGEDGATYYNYVIYRKNIFYATAAEIYPIGGLNTPSIKLQYTAYEGVDPTGSYRDYVLSYVRVEAKNGVSVGTPTFVENGLADEARVVTVVANGIDFEIVGAMDTDLVKYAAALNRDVCDALNACETYAEFEALVKAFSVLLNTKEKLVLDENGQPDAAYDVLADFIANSVIAGDMDTLFSNLRHMTASVTMKELDKLESTVIEGLGESIVYCYSPFGIYYKWLEGNKFLPKD